MHQPIPITDEEGMCFIDSEVVHRLVSIVDSDNRFNCAIIAIQ
jgi:hypothetical protein